MLAEDFESKSFAKKLIKELLSHRTGFDEGIKERIHSSFHAPLELYLDLITYRLKTSTDRLRNIITEPLRKVLLPSLHVSLNGISNMTLYSTS